mmetsp:Transcript_58832/g.175047  ORF Transcript_58832/g.175047 Transcript_58832/m.175047 type:complete len:222 (-) Transcript_58832:139-804(-)
MKTAILASLLASAAAFAPAQTGQASSALNAFENELGVQEPLGFYDPLGMLDDADQERFDRLRYVEVKHGRICQLAFLGQIITRAGFHLGGNIDFEGHSFDSYPNGLAAVFGDDAIPTLGLIQIIGFVGFLELFVMKDSANGAEPGDFPGDFRNGFIDFGWDIFDDRVKLVKRGIELNNGRAAMMGILGLMVHEKLGELAVPAGYGAGGTLAADLPIIGVLQ